jgi:hypothetical protein
MSGNGKLGGATTLLEQLTHCFVHFAFLWSQDMVLLCDKQGIFPLVLIPQQSYPDTIKA